jgi:hypothetical protein
MPWLPLLWAASYSHKIEIISKANHGLPWEVKAVTSLQSIVSHNLRRTGKVPGKVRKSMQALI